MGTEREVFIREIQPIWEWECSSLSSCAGQAVKHSWLGGQALANKQRRIIIMIMAL